MESDNHPPPPYGGGVYSLMAAGRKDLLWRIKHEQTVCRFRFRAGLRFGLGGMAECPYSGMKTPCVCVAGCQQRISWTGAILEVNSRA